MRAEESRYNIMTEREDCDGKREKIMTKREKEGCNRER